MNTFPTVRVTIIQSAILIVLALSALMTVGTVVAYSVFLGGLISIVPSTCFALMIFRHSGPRAIEKVVRSAYIGETIKLVLMGTGFALVFVFVDPLTVPALFGGFLITHMTGLALVARFQHTG